MSRLFLTQEALDVWLLQDRVRIEGEHMVIEGLRYRLLPAVRFVDVAGRGEDAAGLVGKVKTERQLLVLGAEHYMETVTVGGVGYEVRQGFVGALTH